MTAQGAGFPFPLEVHTFRTVVVGTGAAGCNAADSLLALGEKDVAIVTEGVRAGTSRNAGSDKQTYYKLTLSGGDGDSVQEMARTLFDGGCVDGDHALCEAALSAQCFFKLAALGVPFPRNRYGEYVGYKTDHDPRRRATSAGPFTSRDMAEALMESCVRRGARVFEGWRVVKILTAGAGGPGDGGAPPKLLGLLCCRLHAREPLQSGAMNRAPTSSDASTQAQTSMRLSDIKPTVTSCSAHAQAPLFALFRCANVVYATGGPAGLFRDSAYPLGQYGASGLAFEAGAEGKNLTEWQYGLASLEPRWNVSGSYMQALPRFVSCEPGGDPAKGEEFLAAHYRDGAGAMLTQVFLKGYQWPFDAAKAEGGSSAIDLLVFAETQKGREVYLDYTANPGGGAALDYAALSAEARGYLESAGACVGAPIDRLRALNQPAIDFYAGHGVDLARDPLRIALCAQHNNGGVDVDLWWRSRVEGLFVVGEAAGTHGVARPGGSALNAGQVGSLRAAQYIHAQQANGRDAGKEVNADDAFWAVAAPQIRQAMGYAARLLAVQEDLDDDGESAEQAIARAAARMSEAAGAIRGLESIQRALREASAELRAFPANLRQPSRPGDIAELYRLRDTLIAQTVYLAAMEDYIQKGGRSRGGALYTNKPASEPGDAISPSRVQIARYDDATGTIAIRRRDVRPIPDTADDFFENVWRSYRDTGNIP